MKKFMSIGLIVCLLVSLAACSNNNNPTEPTNNGIFYKNENIAINDYRDTIFDFYHFDVTDEDLELYINYHILLPNAEYTEVKDGIVQKEDYVNISVTSKDEDGKIIEQYTTGKDGYFLYLGLGDYMDGLDEEVIGMSVGETKQFKTVLSSKQAVVQVTVNYIQKTEFPEPSDELAQKAGYESLEAFKEYYRNELSAAYAADAYKVFIDSMKKVLIAEVYNYPEELVESYIQKYKDSLAYYANHYKMSEDEYLEKFSRMTYDEWLAQVREQAKKDVETELMLNAILEINGVTLDKDAYEHYLNIMAENAGYPSGKALELEMEKQGVSSDLTRELTMNYAYDIFLLTAKLRLINYTTGDVMVDYVESTEPTTK